ncbi:hypothetical protein M3J09_008988 [Ascochyta lentis]
MTEHPPMLWRLLQNSGKIVTVMIGDINRRARGYSTVNLRIVHVNGW